MSDCKHLWGYAKDAKGQPMFRERSLGTEPLIRCWCVHCGAVKHFTRDQFAGIEKAPA